MLYPGLVRVANVRVFQVTNRDFFGTASVSTICIHWHSRVWLGVISEAVSLHSGVEFVNWLNNFVLWSIRSKGDVWVFVILFWAQLAAQTVGVEIEVWWVHKCRRHHFVPCGGWIVDCEVFEFVTKNIPNSVAIVRFSAEKLNDGAFCERKEVVNRSIKLRRDLT